MHTDRTDQTTPEQAAPVGLVTGLGEDAPMPWKCRAEIEEAVSSGMTRAEAVVHVLQEYEELGPEGIHCSDNEILRGAIEEHQKLTATNPELAKQSLVSQVETSIAYLERLLAFGLLWSERSEPCSSYSLKHYAERWARENGLHPYVCNGALIMAAYYLGLAEEDIEPPNVMFNVPDPEAFKRF